MGAIGEGAVSKAMSQDNLVVEDDFTILRNIILKISSISVVTTKVSSPFCVEECDLPVYIQMSSKETFNTVQALSANHFKNAFSNFMFKVLTRIYCFKNNTQSNAKLSLEIALTKYLFHCLFKMHCEANLLKVSFSLQSFL